jgi:hypothetical protein
LGKLRYGAVMITICTVIISLAAADVSQVLDENQGVYTKKEGDFKSQSSHNCPVVSLEHRSRENLKTCSNTPFPLFVNNSQHHEENEWPNFLEP